MLISAFVFATQIVVSSSSSIQNFKPLPFFCDCTGRTVRSGQKPYCWFSHDVAHFVFSGVIEVELHEDEDGQITLMGYPAQPDNATPRPGSSRSSPKYGGRSTPETGSSEVGGSTGSNMNYRGQQAQCSTQDMYR